MISSESNTLSLIYKEPYSSIILDIMEKNSLFDDDSLLENIELVVPISKVLNGSARKKITKVSYEKSLRGLIFRLQLN